MEHPLLNKDLALWKIRRAYVVKRFDSGCGMVEILCTQNYFRIDSFRRMGWSCVQEEIIILTDGEKALRLDGTRVHTFEAEEKKVSA